MSLGGCGWNPLGEAAFYIVNEKRGEVEACSGGLKARLETMGFSYESPLVPAGASWEEVVSLPESVITGSTMTIEAWCHEEAETGYIRFEGKVKYSSAKDLGIVPPSRDPASVPEKCLRGQIESGPAPCVFSFFFSR